LNKKTKNEQGVPEREYPQLKWELLSIFKYVFTARKYKKLPMVRVRKD